MLSMNFLSTIGNPDVFKKKRNEPLDITVSNYR